MTVGRSAGRTDPGRRRRHNEDTFICEPPLFAVADGMGGAQAGELASRLAAAAVGRAEPDERTGSERVTALLREANRSVYERAAGDASVSGMGTTMTVAIVEDGGVGSAMSATPAPTSCATAASTRSPRTTRSSPSSSARGG
jgi:protein phosphatase